MTLVILTAVVGPLQAADNGITSDQANRIINELAQIRALLMRQSGVGSVQPQPETSRAPVKLDLTGDSVLGSIGAPVTFVEFTDYQCPFCNRFYSEVFGKLKENFIDTGKVRFYSRDLPLDIHPNAMQAAQAGRCAAEQGKFWQMRDRMSENPRSLEPERLLEYAGALDLDTTAFRNCVAVGRYKDAIEKDIMAAKSIGASGTPAFVVGKTTPKGVDGELILGARPYPVFEQKLKDLIK
jgi:protein-disulfide isomerase